MHGAEATAPWLLAAIGNVQIVVIRVPPSSAGLQVGTATGAGYVPARVVVASDDVVADGYC